MHINIWPLVVKKKCSSNTEIANGTVLLLSPSCCQTEFSFRVKHVFFTLLLIESSRGSVSKLQFSKYHCLHVFAHSYNVFWLTLVLGGFLPPLNLARTIWWKRIHLMWPNKNEMLRFSTQLWDCDYVNLFVFLRACLRTDNERDTPMCHRRLYLFISVHTRVLSGLFRLAFSDSVKANHLKKKSIGIRSLCCW